MRGCLLRGIAHELACARSAFAQQKADALARDSMQVFGQHQPADLQTHTIVLTGHTHAAKDIDCPGGGYLNTGTWQNLVRIPEDLSEAVLATWLQALQEDKISRWRRCPAVRVDENGAELLYWDGHALQTWASALA